MEGNLRAHREYIQTLEASLQEEMSRHAPLYGAGLDLLSVPELETLTKIHEEGLVQVRLLLRQRKGGSAEEARQVAHSSETVTQFNRGSISLMASQSQESRENGFPEQAASNRGGNFVNASQVNGTSSHHSAQFRVSQVVVGNQIGAAPISYVNRHLNGATHATWFHNP